MDEDDKAAATGLRLGAEGDTAMAIKMMLFKDGSTGPVAVCDICGAVIRDASEATVYWRRPPDFGEKPGYVYDPVLACGKYACERQAEKGAGNTLSTADLDTALVCLIANAGLPPNGERFRQVTDMAAMLNGAV